MLHDTRRTTNRVIPEGVLGQLDLFETIRRATIRPGTLQIGGRTWTVEPLPRSPIATAARVDNVAGRISVAEDNTLALLRAVDRLRKAAEGVTHV